MKVLVLCSECDYSNAVINNIVSDGYECRVVFENDISRKVLLKRRIKNLGLWTVMGQVAFMLTVPRKLRRTSGDRVAEIIKDFNIDISGSYQNKAEIHKVDSVNADETIEVIDAYNPDVIVVNGTRIIAKRILEQIKCPIINMHMGITPKYRGVHGAYWAIANNDMENCGVTVHMVNAGIDTGDVIAQKVIEVTDEDNYVTYPYIQLGEGLKLESEVLARFDSTGEIPTHVVDLPSHLWYHPTLGQYIKANKKR